VLPLCQTTIKKARIGLDSARFNIPLDTFKNEAEGKEGIVKFYTTQAYLYTIHFRSYLSHFTRKITVFS